MKIDYLISILFACAITLSGCSDWLHVKPKTLVEESDMYDSESGFKDVVTGFYISMTQEGLYGKNLTYGWMDILAQRYDFEDYNILQNTVYEYKGASKPYVQGSYSKLYNIIANINNFLSLMEKYKENLHTKNYYEIMKAESLGLRAFLHFDLLRMFGPVYQLNPKEKSIPYRTNYDIIPTPRLAANIICDSILADLHKAHDIMEEVDPKVFTELIDHQKKDPFMIMRQLRMNFYATKAMLARVYCYKGDNESKKKALSYASEVMDTHYFSLAETNVNNPILFSEHIFSLNVFEVKKIVDPMFNPSNISGLWSNKPETIEALFETRGAGTNDFRAKEHGFITKGHLRILNKYNQDVYSGEYSGKSIVPLIRLPEMYYIAAECAGSAAESAEYLNIVRQKRGIPASDLLVGGSNWDKPDTRINFDNTKTMRINEIMKEYQKEFFGEGQLFFFYKRHNYRTFFHSLPNIDMRQHYVMPIHDNEISFGYNE